MKSTLTIILILLALLFLQRECSRPPAHYPVPDTIRITRVEYDSFPYDKPIPKPYPVEVIRVDTFPSIVDTALILHDFFAKNIYNRTLLDDSVAYIALLDTVTQNQLQNSHLTYKNRRPTIIENTTIIHPPPPQRFQLYAGGFLQSRIFPAANPVAEPAEAPTISFGASLFAKTRRDHLYGIGYDPINKNAQLNILWKIKLK